jgi:hypothetical protein
MTLALIALSIVVPFVVLALCAFDARSKGLV